MREARGGARMEDRPLGVYLHIPFCRRKCNYCAFYSAPAGEAAWEEYADALCRHIALWGERLGRRAVDTVYFGGGTPSLLWRQLPRVLAELGRCFQLDAGAEISLEANPGTVGREELRALRQAGFNRLSLGVQSAVEGELRALGRLHTAAEAMACVEAAREAGFANLSLDFMLGLPGQSEESLERMEDFVRRAAPQHLSAYILKVEAGTPFGEMGEALQLPDDDTAADLYESCVARLSALGYGQYEVSNFALPGFACRHNEKYWSLEEYLGIGPAAHSLLGGARFFYPADRAAFVGGGLEQLQREGTPDWEEYAMLRLRTAAGLDTGRAGLPDGLLERARPFEKPGLLHIDGPVIRLTPKGFLVSTPLIAEILYG